MKGHCWTRKSLNWTVNDNNVWTPAGCCGGLPDAVSRPVRRFTSISTITNLIYHSPAFVPRWECPATFTAGPIRKLPPERQKNNSVGLIGFDSDCESWKMCMRCWLWAAAMAVSWRWVPRRAPFRPRPPSIAFFPCQFSFATHCTLYNFVCLVVVVVSSLNPFH